MKRLNVWVSNANGEGWVPGPMLGGGNVNMAARNTKRAARRAIQNKIARKSRAANRRAA